MKRPRHQVLQRPPGRRLHKRSWVRLDNAANIFIATMDDIDTKVFRLGAELEEDVDAALLQTAVDRVYDRYPLYHAVMRRGFFWYYLEDSDLRPVVAPDVLVPCAHLYHFDRRELLFRVVHHRRRISLEVFHALSDGTGGWWFFRDLLTEYLRLRHGSGLAAEGPTPGTSLSADSFVDYFGDRAKRFEQAAHAPSGDFEASGKPPAKQKMFGSENPGAKVLRVKGTVTPDKRNRIIEVTLPADQVLALARGMGASLTVYLVALYFEAVRRSTPDLARTPRVAVSVPVNLRSQFPSESARNFFAVTRLEHTYGVGDDSVKAVAASLKEQLLPQLTKQSLQAKVDKLLELEKHPLGRLVPRVVKDIALNIVNRINNRSLTLAISGLGKLSLPVDVDDRVRELHLSVSSPRPQFCVVTHKNWLTIGFTSPFVETDLVAAYTQVLAEQGVPVQAAPTKVLPRELAVTR